LAKYVIVREYSTRINKFVWYAHKIVFKIFKFRIISTCTLEGAETCEEKLKNYLKSKDLVKTGKEVIL